MLTKTLVLKLEYDGEEDLEYMLDDFIEALNEHDYDYIQSINEDLDYRGAKIICVNEKE